MKVLWPCLLLCAAAPVAAQRAAPWIAADARSLADNQPRTTASLHLEHGRYLTDTFGFMLSTDVAYVSGDGASSSTVAPGGALIVAVPALRMGVVTGARALLNAPAGTVLLWHARTDVGLGQDVKLRASAARDRYTSTVASIDTTVRVTSLELALDRAAAPGWAGAAALRRDDYGDANPVMAAQAWLLAPLARAATYSLRAGYAVGWQDASESRWVGRNVGDTRGPFAPPGAVLPGRYDPYYTPHDQLAHSVIADAAVADGRGGWIKLSAAMGVHATELAPQQRSTGRGAGTIEFAQRSYTPYRIEAGWWLPLSDRTSITLDAEYSRSAFYNAARAHIGFLRAL